MELDQKFNMEIDKNSLLKAYYETKREDSKNILKYWLEQGVIGFLDGTNYDNYLYEDIIIVRCYSENKIKVYVKDYLQ